MIGMNLLLIIVQPGDQRQRIAECRTFEKDVGAARTGQRASVRDQLRRI